MTTRVRLSITARSRDEKEYIFAASTNCIVGRAPDCDIRLPIEPAYADVSRHHCLVEIDPPRVRVRDLGSRNGTYVNGEKIGQRPDDSTPDATISNGNSTRELTDGDEVRVGSVLIRVGIGASETGSRALFMPFGAG
jgi:pSer/pThr/pTyr-binding forkhead associated (FHA) protein